MPDPRLEYSFGSAVISLGGVKADDEFSTMARVTSFPAAIGAKLIALGKTNLKGIRAPEECILGENYQWFLEELQDKNITIKEKAYPVGEKELFSA